MPHELSIKTVALPLKATGALVVYVGEDAAPAGGAASVWQATGLDWSKLATASGFKGKQGQVLDLLAPPNVDAQRLLVLGSGKPGQGTSLSAWTDRGGSLASKLMGLRVTKAAVLLDDEAATPDRVGELAAGLTLRHYRFDRYKSASRKEEVDNGLSVTLHVANKAAADRAIADRMAVADGQILARDLMHEPPNVLGTTEIMEKARALGERGLAVEVLDRDAMEKLGMGALLAVAQGSDRPPYLVIMQWKGGKDGEAPIAFIGKGVVFDTGGISIKPGAGMEDMKGDMGGAAAVTGLMQALATRKAPVNAIGVIGLVENMPSSNAYRPGDILKAMSGTTIEVVNTDAEGRLVLADALWYTQGRFKPKFMINLATLTGAIGVALGQDHAGLFSNNDELVRQADRRRPRHWRKAVAHAHGTGLRKAHREPFRRHQELGRSPGRLDHRRAVPAALRQRRALGASGHRCGGTRLAADRNQRRLGLRLRGNSSRPAGARLLRG